MVFYDQPATADGAVRHTAATPGGATATETLDITLNGLQHDVHRVVAAVCVDGGRFADVYEARVTPTTPARPPSTCSSPPRPRNRARLLEIYRRDGTWRLRAVGQGYDDGLARLARDFGVDVA